MSFVILLLLIGTAAASIGNPFEDRDAVRNRALDAKTIRDLGVDYYPILLGLRSEEEKQAFDSAFIALGMEKISFPEFMDRIRQSAPSAFATLRKILVNLEHRLAGLKSPAAKEYVDESIELAAEVARAMAEYKMGEISLEKRNDLIANNIAVAKFNLKRSHARLEILESFGDLLPHIFDAKDIAWLIEH